MIRILPELMEEYVGQIIYDSIMAKREEVYIPWFFKEVWGVVGLMPQFCLDRLFLFFGIF